MAEIDKRLVTLRDLKVFSDYSKEIFATRFMVGSPLLAATSADMTDTERVYVYTGSETGYTSGNWYYYDGESWTSGGVYNSTAFQTDVTLSVAGAAADSKAVGDTLAEDVADLEAKLNSIATINTIAATADRNSDIFTLYGTNGRISYTDGHLTADSAYHVFLYTFDTDMNISVTKNAGGIVGAVLYSEELDTIPTSTSAAKQYFVKGARSDQSGDSALPTSGSPWACTAGQMIAIFTQDNAANPNTNFTFAYSSGQVVLNEDVLLADGQIQQVLDAYHVKNPVIKYGTVDTDIGSRGKEQITVWLPSVSGYVKYAFVRCEYDSYNSNVWRIDRCYACGDDRVVLFPITNAGEWEMAIKIDGASDFIGGNAHGDEVYTAFHVLIDGIEVGDITEIEEQEFETASIIETSLMYDPRDGATLSTRTDFTPVGTHGREYIITRDGIRLKQMVKLDTALTLGASYMTMLPILRGNDTASTLQITDHVIADNDYVEYDVSVGGTSGGGYGWKHNVKRATIWGNTSGVSATVEMLEQPDIENSGARQFQVQNTVNSYNKLYWSICGVGDSTYNASANERFVTDTLFKIVTKGEQ